ncbi:MAG: FAD-dependent oxidoreductase [Lachnospiraceae bacterium]
MKEVLIIGSGISGLSCAIKCAEKGNRVTLVSPYPSERAQSVMAAGGINAALNTKGEADSIICHVEDTLKGGCNIASRKAVEDLCGAAPGIIHWLESIGTVFARDEKGNVDLRPFGGQTYKRTAYAGASTGKQIVTSLVQEARKYECVGLLRRRLGLQFHSALIKDHICYGALFYNENTRKLESIYADAVVMATGGQNGLFGKTTGSALCDGYAAGKLFLQGAELKNLEFIQYHPTTIETPQKKMLITEAARGEGGRLYYLDQGKRVYFMEDKYGTRGNLMPRDVVSKCIYDAPGQVYLDIAFLGKNKINEKLSEVADLCMRYKGLDASKESIPVSPSVHFFMGGLAVNRSHQTNLKHLYAIGECASIYHGANRLGGNSLLAAVYSGKTAAEAIQAENVEPHRPEFVTYISEQEKMIEKRLASVSRFSAVYVKQDMAKIMNEDLGITRTEQKLKQGIEGIDYYLSVSEKLAFDCEISPYQAYSLQGMLTLARAVLTCAEARKETRGSHIREDYPESLEKFKCATKISYDNGKFAVRFTEEE